MSCTLDLEKVPSGSCPGSFKTCDSCSLSANDSCSLSANDSCCCLHGSWRFQREKDQARSCWEIHQLPTCSTGFGLEPACTRAGLACRAVFSTCTERFPFRAPRDLLEKSFPGGMCWDGLGPSHHCTYGTWFG